MKVQASSTMLDKMMQYGWNIDDVSDVACGEFLFLYGEYDEVSIVDVTENSVDFMFRNHFAGDIVLRVDAKGNTMEVK